MNKCFTTRTFVFCMLLLAAPVSLIAQQRVIVTDCNLQGWVKNITTVNAVNFTNNPATVPSGKGSLQLVSLDQGFVRLRSTAYHGVPLTAINAFSYDTYIEARGNTIDAPFIVLQVDINGDNNFEHNLVFNPMYQVPSYTGPGFPNQGPTQENIWQTWDLLYGAWWLGPPPRPDPDNGGELFSLATYISRFPAARILNATNGAGGIRITAGSPGIFASGFTGYVDKFVIGVNNQVRLYDFEKTIADAGPDQQVIYGYGSNCVTLTGSGGGGVSPYTYSWSPGGSNPSSASTTVCPTVTTNYTLSVTDINGCTGTDQVTVQVKDVRCGNKLDKVTVCHNNETICVAAEAVPAHLAHGDQLGPCPDQLRVNTPQTAIKEVTDEIEGFSLFPNPLEERGQLQFILSSSAFVQITLYDNTGRKVRDIAGGFRTAGKQQVTLDRNGLVPGLYHIRLNITSGNVRLQQSAKLLISR